jgi:peptide/nickel transport system permease protein
VKGLRSPSVYAGAFLLTAMLLLVLVGPLAVQYGPTDIDLARRLQPPSADHWFGTDELGRDLFARIAYGGRLTLFSAVAVVACVVAIGLTVGGLSALAPRWVDTAVMRGVDVLLSTPGLVLAMALAAALGPGLLNAMIALTVARAPAFVRLARSQALIVRRMGYVESAQLNGAGNAHVLVFHLAPNVAPALIVQGVSDVSGVILAAAALGFIGLGAQPPAPEWGALVASGRLFFLDCWWYAVFPGLAIGLSSIGFTLLGDAARDWIDPRSRSRGAS